MDNVSIKNQQAKKGKWQFEVVIGDNVHIITLDRDYYLQLSDEKVTPGQLVVSSVMFLLEREAKESILKEFDLRKISQYFPEYEETIKI
ncbi:hypothetical protein K8R42_04870 [bacterium]|nr:hypothetical protein [bacterium]